jgi:hydrogenase maturation protease
VTLPGDEELEPIPAGGEAGETVAPTREPAGVLIIGYGNRLRGDDGFGPRAAELLAADPRLAGARVLARHQLTPELAADLAEAWLAVLVDVNVTDEAGVVSVGRLDETRAPGAASSHHADPADLAGLTRELYGAAPTVYMVSVGAASLELGEALSGAVEKALPAVVEAVIEIVMRERAAGSAG